MQPAVDFDDLGGGAYRWEAYDPASKVDLSASAIVSAGGLYFVDPIPLRKTALDELLATAQAMPAGIFLTNANHVRASEDFGRTLGVPIFNGSTGLPDFTVIPLPGAAPGEAALHGGDVLVVGDALINLASHPFSVLPDNYCEDPAELRRSLARLLDYEFSRLLFAHGEPVMGGAQARLAALLGAHP